MAAPATGHRVNAPRDDLGLFNAEIPAHREVVKGPHRSRLDHVEASQVSTGRTAVSGSHVLNGIGYFETSSPVVSTPTAYWTNLELID